MDVFIKTFVGFLVLAIVICVIGIFIEYTKIALAVSALLCVSYIIGDMIIGKE